MNKEVAELLPPSGEFSEGEHLYPVRVFYEDTDAAGIVYYANYLRFAERARSELIRKFGWNHGAMMSGDEKIAFAVRSCSINYLHPAKIDDALLIKTSVVEVKGASLTMKQNIYRNDLLMVEVLVVLVALALNSGKPARLPAQVKEALSSLCIK